MRVSSKEYKDESCCDESEDWNEDDETECGAEGDEDRQFGGL